MDRKINILVSSRNDEERKYILAAITAQKNLQIIGVENNETGTIIKSERLKPDVLIMDSQPPGIDGAELAPIIHRRSPSTSIVMMCNRDEANYASRALRAGISGFLLKNADMDKLIHAVNIVSLGGYYVSASITTRAFNTITFMRQLPGQIIDINKQWLDSKNLIQAFSQTERGIITEIALGLSDKEIARRLNYSTGTIRNYVTIIKRKTKQKNRIQIAIYSLTCGLISLEQLDILKNNRQFTNDTIQ
jgi:DNA-binding NarL/FixJ family response regulator